MSFCWAWEEYCRVDYAGWATAIGTFLAIVGSAVITKLSLTHQHRNNIKLMEHEQSRRERSRLIGIVEAAESISHLMEMIESKLEDKTFGDLNTTTRDYFDAELKIHHQDIESLSVFDFDLHAMRAKVGRLRFCIFQLSHLWDKFKGPPSIPSSELKRFREIWNEVHADLKEAIENLEIMLEKTRKQLS